MNKTILSLLLSATTLTTFGQFKVQSDGKIAIQTTSTASSPISINCGGSSSYYVYCSNTGGRGGISFTATGNSSKNSHWDRYLGQMPRTPSTCPHDQFEEYDDMTSHRAEMNIENGEIN